MIRKRISKYLAVGTLIGATFFMGDQAWRRPARCRQR